MSTETINHETLDDILKALAYEYRRRGGKKMQAEIILVGGAAVIGRYGFRDMTTDIDAIIMASSAMEDAARTVGNRFGLPDGWFNDDFRKSDSYSPKLREVSTFYRSYSDVLEIRTITAEYLIAMKLKSRPEMHWLSSKIIILIPLIRKILVRFWKSLQRSSNFTPGLLRRGIFRPHSTATYCPT